MDDSKKIWVLYTGWLIVSLFAFAWILFPGELMGKFLSVRVAAAVPGIKARVTEIKPSFPAGASCSIGDVAFEDRALVDGLRLTVTPSWLSIAGPEKELDLAGGVAGGTITGHVTAKTSGERSLGVAAEVLGVQLEKIALMSSGIPGLSLSGKADLAGNFASSAGHIKDSSIEISARKVAAQIDHPMVPLDLLTFRKVDAKAEFLAPGGTISLKELVFEGGMINGSMKGEVILRKNRPESRLNLSGKVRLTHALIARLSKKIPLAQLAGKRNLAGGIGFTITGTAGKPNFKLR